MPIQDRVVVIGQGYVGLPLTMRAVEAGFDVVGIDVDVRKIAALQAGESYIGDVDAAAVSHALTTGRYAPSASYADATGFEIAVITVPTPLRDSLPDLSFIEKAAAGLAPHVSRGCLVILESTSYPGTTEDVVAPLLAGSHGLVAGQDFGVGFSPERIDPGNAQWQFRNTPKIVAGINEASRAQVERFYARLVDTIVPVSTPKEAELAKLLENTFRHINIALVNEIAILARQLDIDIWEAIDAAATKPFGFMKFTPGPGVGGHCLPVDPSYLSWQTRRKLGRASRFIELANDVNEHMPEYVVQRVIEGLNRRKKALHGSNVLVLGLAYKRNTADTRESPALRIIELLQTFGSEITVADPEVAGSDFPAGINRAELDAELLESMDAVIITTGHDAFDYALVEGASAYVLDTQRVTSPGAVDVL